MRSAYLSLNIYIYCKYICKILHCLGRADIVLQRFDDQFASTMLQMCCDVPDSDVLCMWINIGISATAAVVLA